MERVQIWNFIYHRYFIYIKLIDMKENDQNIDNIYAIRRDIITKSKYFPRKKNNWNNQPQLPSISLGWQGKSVFPGVHPRCTFSSNKIKDFGDKN